MNQHQGLSVSAWPFGRLRMFGYMGLLVDPPWRYEMRSENGYAKAPEAHYPTMSDEELLALPVNLLAGRECIMVLAAVWPRLDFAVDLVRAWGFNLVTGGTWLKRASKGALRVGPGYCLRTVCEPFLVARVGEAQAVLTDVINAIGETQRIAIDEIGSITIDGLAREHSRKPPEYRQLLERLTPQAFRAELFAREPWPGNEVWGNETTKFSEAVQPCGERPELPSNYKVEHGQDLLPGL